jgi:hypothetical protein
VVITRRRLRLALKSACRISLAIRLREQLIPSSRSSLRMRGRPYRRFQIYKHFPNLLRDLSIFSLVLASWALSPCILATFGYVKHTTHDRNSTLLLVLFDELVFHRWSWEKMLTTFFRISRYGTDSF